MAPSLAESMVTQKITRRYIVKHLLLELLESEFEDGTYSIVVNKIRK